jgi:hypothetical protein
MSSFYPFLASSICALVVFAAALTAWLRGDDWERRLPPTVPVLLVWMVVFFILGCAAELGA